jgi:hypothetical protein
LVDSSVFMIDKKLHETHLLRTKIKKSRKESSGFFSALPAALLSETYHQIIHFYTVPNRWITDAAFICSLEIVHLNRKRYCFPGISILHYFPVRVKLFPFRNPPLYGSHPHGSSLESLLSTAVGCQK